MSIGFYQRNRGVMHVLSVVLVTLMLMSCLSPALIQPARAEALVGLSLIAAILGSFGISAVASGSVEGMLDGLEGLMQDFSESLGHTRDWFRSLFDADTFVSSYGRLGLAGTLVDTIKLFIEWLRVDKSLSPSTPVSFSTSGSLSVNGQSIPVIPYSGLVYIQGNTSGSGNLCTASSIYAYDLIPRSAGVSLLRSTSYPVYNSSYYLEWNPLRFRTTPYTGSFTSSPIIFLLVSGQYLILCYIADNGDSGDLVCFYSGRSGYDNFHNSRVDVSVLCSTVGASSGILPLSSLVNSYVPGESWQINDDNLDLDYLDNDDGSTKDVIFSPSIPLGMTDNPDFVMPSLGDISGFNDLTGDILDYNKATSLTEEGTVTGELETSQEFQPGDSDVPSISIPAGGWFLSIWHYVVKALQDSAAGIAFIMSLLRTVIPPAILNLAWAACVLLITFGILNKFLK